MQVQYALNLDFHHCEMTSQTIECYRKIFRENELAIDVMKSIIVKLVDKLNVTVTEQRLDSTHIISNMSLWGKTKFFQEINRRFESAFEHIREIIMGGKLSNIYEIRLNCHNFQWRADWKTLLDFGGGQLLN